MSILKELRTIGSNIRVLYVEDDALLRESVTHYLSKIFYAVDVAKDGQEGLEIFSKCDYDIVITDIQMPNMNGLEMINAIKEINPNQEIILTTAFSDVAYFMEAISLNVNAYIIKPFDFDKLNAALYKVSKNLSLSRENENYKKNLETMVEQRTVQNLLLEEEKIDNYEKTLLSLVELVEKRDAYTGGHSLRVATYSKLIAKEMGYNDAICELLYRAGILHDIGKIATPDAVLLKPGNLDSLEYSLIKEHVQTGSLMLANIPMYTELAKIIAAHHERYDGTGYPQGLSANEIPELSRVMIVADAFDAMTTNRIYKPKMSLQSALLELQKYAGTQFDTSVITPALNVLKNVKIDADIHQLPSTQMENKRFAYFFEDPTTKAYNQTYLELVLIQNENIPKQQYINVVFVHNFTLYNNTYGWDAGNLFLKNIVSKLLESFPESSIFRLHGDDFVILSNAPAEIQTSTLDLLIQESGDIISISQQKFNTQEHNIHSMRDLEAYLNQR